MFEDINSANYNQSSIQQSKIWLFSKNCWKKQRNRKLQRLQQISTNFAHCNKLQTLAKELRYSNWTRPQKRTEIQSDNKITLPPKHTFLTIITIFLSYFRTYLYKTFCANANYHTRAHARQCSQNRNSHHSCNRYQLFSSISTISASIQAQRPMRLKRSKSSLFKLLFLLLLFILSWLSFHIYCCCYYYNWDYYYHYNCYYHLKHNNLWDKREANNHD
jgi:hypothetical protein